MGPIEFTSLVLLTSVVAGLLGALTGLGGGVVIVPVLALVFRVYFFTRKGVSHG